MLAAPREHQFRPDIEGLRAVAVLLVVLFHASIGGFGGGFVGVDVFFVVSGFLITGLLLRELASTGTISLVSFYARRARRLLPAAALVLLATLLLSVVLLPPLLVPRVAGDVAAAALYVSNVSFAAQATNYFAAGQAPSPILHFWSLGVEEQFYLFWPAIMLVVAAGARLPARRIGLAIAAISVGSLAFSIWLTGTNEPWAFYLLPTRAWELGLGGLLAVAGPQLGRLPGRVATVAGWAGLGLILVAAAAFSDTTPFPGTAALLPTVGAALVILAGSRPTALGAARFLGTSVPRYFGRISYSLYLWHWPLLVLPVEAAGASLPLAERLALVGVSILLAAGTQRWVEDPLRRGRLVGTLPRRNLAAAGGLALVVALVSTGTGFAAEAEMRHPGPAEGTAANQQALDALLNQLASEAPVTSEAPGDAQAAASAGASPGGAPVPGSGPAGAPGAPTGGPAGAPSAPTPHGAAATTAPQAPVRSPAGAPLAGPARPATRDGPLPSNLQPSLLGAQNDYPQSYYDGCNVQQDGGGGWGSCLYGNPNASTTIALFGDSHALSWFPAVEQFAQQRGWLLLSLTMSTCSPATIPIFNPAYGRISWECASWRTRAIARIEQFHPDILLVTGTRGFDTTDASGHQLSAEARTRAWEAGMAKTLSQLVPAAGRVILISDTPLSRVDPPVCLSQHPTNTLACATSVSQAINQAWLAEEQKIAREFTLGYIDPEWWVCPSSPCPVVLGNYLVYRDAGHLSSEFSQALADRLGQAIIAELPPRRGPALS